ncbi:MAG TPA: FAD-binding protein, partial [Beijerinckia sp.]|nr:FAD-binding protein [Beijerinckia sp.]
MNTVCPRDAAELAACVAEAGAQRMPLGVTGLATKTGLGRPVKAAAHLDLSAFNGVTFYEPQELVLSALAATRIETIERLLAEYDQELAFEPMSFAAIYGTGAGTLGGCLMANLSGPRRIKAGAAR